MRPETPTFWLLDGRTGWRTGARQGVSVGTVSGIRLGASPEGPLAVTSEDGSLGGLTLPRNLTLDEDGTLYLLDPHDRLVRRFDPATRSFIKIAGIGSDPDHPGPCADDVRDLHRPAEIAVAGGNLYIADQGDDAHPGGRLLVFALASLALLKVWGSREWDPVDLAGQGCTAWVLDRAGGRVYRHRVGADRLELLVDVPAASGRWTGLAVDRQDRIYLLANGDRTLEVFDAAGRPQPLPDDPGDLRDRFDPPPIRLDSQDRFCLPASLMTPCNRRPPDPGPPPEAPLRLCAAGSGGLVFDRRGRPVTVEPDERPGSALYRTAGSWTSDALDSGIYRAQWHRIELELADLPAGTQVEVSTYTDQRPLPAHEIASLPEDRWSTRRTVTAPGDRPPGTPTGLDDEFLVQSRGGQYLLLRLRLHGDGYGTPTVRSIRAHYPRDSYLTFLPAIFAADEDGRWFLERFLSVFQTEWDALEDVIAHVKRYFDPGAVPAGPALDWLAGWLALPLEGSWTAEQRRRLLLAAPGLAGRRGTPDGVRGYLRAYLEAMTGQTLGHEGYPQLVEGYRERDLLLLAVEPGAALGRGAPLWSPEVVGRLQLGVFAREGESRLVSTGDPQRDAFQEYAHRFRVFVPAGWIQTGADERMVRRAIDAEKPAHTAYDLCLVEPRFRVGVQSTVGLDTIVAADPEARLVCRYDADPAPSLPPSHRLGYDTVLACPPTDGPRFGPAVRLGVETNLL